MRNRERIMTGIFAKSDDYDTRFSKVSFRIGSANLSAVRQTRDHPVVLAHQAWDCGKTGNTGMVQAVIARLS